MHYGWCMTPFITNSLCLLAFAAQEEAPQAAQAESFVSEHSIEIGGTRIDYTAASAGC